MDDNTEQYIGVSTEPAKIHLPEREYLKDNSAEIERIKTEKVKELAEETLNDLERFSKQEYVKDPSLKIESIGLEYNPSELDGNLYTGNRRKFTEAFFRGEKAEEVRKIFSDVPGYTQKEIQKKFRKEESAKIVCGKWDSAENGFLEKNGKPVGIPFGARKARIEGVKELAASGDFCAIFLDTKFIDGLTEKTGQPCFIFKIEGPGEKTDKGTVYPISVPEERLIGKGYKELTNHRAFGNMTILIPDDAHKYDIENDMARNPRQDEKREALVTYRLAKNAYPKHYGKYEPSEKAKTSCLPDKYHWERNSSENKRQIQDSTLQYEKTGKIYRPLNEINTTRSSMFSHTR